MTVFVKTLFDQNGNQIGAILDAAIVEQTNVDQKRAIENELRLYAIKELYPNELISTFSQYLTGFPSIVVVKCSFNEAKTHIVV